MGIITLTTDLGHRDFYLAAVKGSIFNQLPNIQLVDISHHIPAFNIVEGAFVFKNAFHFFPKKTIHILGIHCDYSENSRYLAFAYRDHYFVGPDNGIFSLIFEGVPEKMVEINLSKRPRTKHFDLKDILVDAACHLGAGGTLDGLGNISLEWVQKMGLKPVFGNKLIRGTVIYIDDYQNVITNITQIHFQESIENGAFIIRFKRGETLKKISYHYGEVPEGEKLCLFGSSGHLEIAINKGKAAGLLGLKIDDLIQIEYQI